MELKFKRILHLAAIFCGVTLFMHAADDNGAGSCSTCPETSCNPCIDPCPCEPCQDEAVGQISCVYKEITPNAGPRVACGADVFVLADFIYWTSRQDCMNYSADSIDDQGASTLSKGSVREPNWNFDPGFRVGLGLNICHDGWDVLARYTWLRSSPSDSHSGNNQKASYRPVGVSSDTGFGFDKAKADWTFHYNVLDLELGRNYFVSQYLTLRPHVGLRAAWNTQDGTVRYYTDNGADNNTNIDKKVITSDQTGVGIRTGLDTSWYFACGISLYSEFSFAGVWLHEDLERKDTFKTSEDATSETIKVWTQLNNHTIVPVAQWALGLRWDTWTCDDEFHFSLAAGWEETVWINYNKIAHRVERCPNGDFLLQGLTVKARLDF